MFVKYKLLHLRTLKRELLFLVKTPLLSKEINDLMDKILDSNGNKISQLKDYLTPEHYRMVRAGCDVSEWEVDEQEKLLSCLKNHKFE